MEASPTRPSRRRVPGWLWIVVPMLTSALLFGAIAVAVRSGGDGGDEVAGPAGQLPAVVAAAEDLLGTVPGEADVAASLGRAYGEVAAGFGRLADDGDDLAFAAAFDRLPDAEARLLGRTLGEIQTQLAPTSQDGTRDESDRAGDIVFALSLSRAFVQTADPSATPRDQALAVLPFAVQDLSGFDALAASFADGELPALASRIDDALSEAGASELISSVANDVSRRIPEDYAADFFEGYAAGTT